MENVSFANFVSISEEKKNRPVLIRGLIDRLVRGDDETVEYVKQENYSAIVENKHEIFCFDPILEAKRDSK